MALIITDSENYINIARAIREKTGDDGLILPTEMAEKIRSLDMGYPSLLASSPEAAAALDIPQNIGRTFKYTGATTEQFVNGVYYIITEEL